MNGPAKSAPHFSRSRVSPVASLGSLMSVPVTWLTVAFATAICASVATVGADARWLVALGREVVEQGGIPAGVPFAAATSAGGGNGPALGEPLSLWLDAGLGDRGLVLAQALAVAVALSLVDLDMQRRRAPELSRVLVLLLVAVACLAAFVVVRAQVFSLALFPLLLLVLRSEVRAPSRRICRVGPRALRDAQPLEDAGLLPRRARQRGCPARGGALVAPLAARDARRRFRCRGARPRHVRSAGAAGSLGSRRLRRPRPPHSPGWAQRGRG